MFLWLVYLAYRQMPMQPLILFPCPIKLQENGRWKDSWVRWWQLHRWRKAAYVNKAEGEIYLLLPRKCSLMVVKTNAILMKSLLPPFSELLVLWHCFPFNQFWSIVHAQLMLSNNLKKVVRGKAEREREKRLSSWSSLISLW